MGDVVSIPRRFPGTNFRLGHLGNCGQFKKKNSSLIRDLSVYNFQLYLPFKYILNFVTVNTLATTLA